MAMKGVPVRVEHLTRSPRVKRVRANRKPKPAVTIVDDVSFQACPGMITALLGINGSGKSTLMHIIGLLDKPTSGVYELDTESTANLEENKLAQIRNKKIIRRNRKARS